MMLSRRVRRPSIWIALFALLAMQIAVSAYACPFAIGSAGANAQADCASGMGGADLPNLCKAHNDTTFQIKADHAPTAPLVAHFVVVAILAPPDNVNDAGDLPSVSYHRDRLAPDGSPPLFLRLQVLRI